MVDNLATTPGNRIPTTGVRVTRKEETFHVDYHYVSNTPTTLSLLSQLPSVPRATDRTTCATEDSRTGGSLLFVETGPTESCH